MGSYLKHSTFHFLEKLKRGKRNAEIVRKRKRKIFPKPTGLEPNTASMLPRQSPAHGSLSKKR
jgi:hypothetical protein